MYNMLMSETAQDKADWSFHEEDSELADQPAIEPTEDRQPISWTASEYVAHEKGTGWYVGLAIVTAMVCGAVWLISSGDVFSVGVIVIVAILFGVLAGKHPRELPFCLDDQGLSIANKLYPYSIFKSFAVHDDGALSSINLMPLKRFMPDLSIYLPPDQKTKILDALSEHLPHDQRAEHIVDRLMKRARF